MIFPIVLVPLAISYIIMLLLYRFTGNTLGKHLAGIEIVPISGRRKLTVAQFLSRELEIFVRAQALFIPIINWVANYRCKQDLEKNGVTVYDDGLYVVIDRAQSEFRQAFVGLVALTLLLGPQIVRYTPWNPAANLLSNAVTRSWTNPVSNIQISLPDGWHINEIEIPGGVSQFQLYSIENQEQFSLVYDKVPNQIHQFKTNGRQYLDQILSASPNLKTIGLASFSVTRRPFWIINAEELDGAKKARILLTPSNDGLWTIAFFSPHAHRLDLKNHEVFNAIIDTIRYEPTARS